MAGPIVFRTPKDRKNRQNDSNTNNSFSNNNRRGNSYNYNKYSTNVSLSNDDRIDPELEWQIHLNGAIEVLGLEKVFEICLQHLQGKRQLPRYITPSECYNAFSEWEWKHGPYFACDWGHHPLTCSSCRLYCFPTGHCNHHGLRE